MRHSNYPSNTQIGCECDKDIPTGECFVFGCFWIEIRLISIVNEPKFHFGVGECQSNSIASRIYFTVCFPWKWGARKEFDKNSIHKHEAKDQNNGRKWDECKLIHECDTKCAIIQMHISVLSQMRNGQFSVLKMLISIRFRRMLIFERCERKSSRQGFWHKIYGNFSFYCNSNGLLQLPMQLEWQLFAMHNIV